MANEGWVKIFRKFSEWEWFNISEMVHLFIYLLINANHQDGEWRGIKVKRGQILTGINSMNSDTKISIQTIRTCLKRLEKTNEINIQSTNKYSIITICKYEDYQGDQQTTNKQPNKQLTNNQQTTNYKQEEEEFKEEKEDKNEKKKEYISKIQKEFYQSLTHFTNEFSAKTLRDFYDYWSEPNKSLTKIKWQLEKTWDTKKRLTRWSNNNFNKNEKTFTNNRPDKNAETFRAASDLQRRIEEGNN